MKSRLLVLFALLFCLLAPAQARARVSFEFFFDNLDPYGEWVELPQYGYCWRPSGVDADWRPYSDGYWTYTDAGWTWVSYEDWGGITYHYGRWAFIEDEGWCWVPGYEWGPAWVSWRSSDDYVGWAPLPPDVRFVPEVGISVWVDRTYDIGPSYYNFCRVRNFGAPVMRGVIVPRRENVVIINQTVNITNITVNRERNVIYNGGPSYDQVRHRVERPIPTLRLVQETDVRTDRRRAWRAQQRGNELLVAAPEVEAPTQKIRPPKPAKVITNARIDKGWENVPDPQKRKEIRQRMEQQAAGLTPENAPAKPVALSVEKQGLLQPAPTPAPIAGQSSATQELKAPESDLRKSRHVERRSKKTERAPDLQPSAPVPVVPSPEAQTGAGSESPKSQSVPQVPIEQPKEQRRVRPQKMPVPSNGSGETERVQPGLGEEQQRRAKEQQLEQQRLERAQKAMEEQRSAEQQRAEQQRAEQQRAEQQRAEQQRAEQQRAEQQRAEQQRAEQQRAEQQRAERQRAEQQRLERAQQLRERQQQKAMEAQQRAEQRSQIQRAQQLQERQQAVEAQQRRLERENAVRMQQQPMQEQRPARRQDFQRQQQRLEMVLPQDRSSSAPQSDQKDDKKKKGD